MLKHHVSIEDGEVVFDFPAKSGRRRVQAIVDPDVLEVITALKQRRGGKQLLVHRAAGGWTEVRAEDVNSYQGSEWRRFHRQGLPHVERDGPCRGRAGRNGRAREKPNCAPAGGWRSRQDRRRVSREHANRLPCLLYRPPRDRPLPLRQHYRAVTQAYAERSDLADVRHARIEAAVLELLAVGGSTIRRSA